MDSKVLLEVAKRLKEHPEVPSRLARHPYFKKSRISSWGRPEPIKVPKKAKKKARLTKVQREILKAFKEYDKACVKCEVPSGGWCRCCEKYSCGKGGANHT